MSDEVPDNENHARAQSPASVWRSLVFPLVLVGSIVGVLLFVDSGRPIPLLRSGSDKTVGGVDELNYFLLGSRGIELGATDEAAPKLNELAPNFALLTPDGEVVTLTDFRGQTVVLNFWATWCIPCRQEFPEFVKVYENRKNEGLTIVAVNVKEAKDSVRKFANEFGATFPVLLDTQGSVSEQYRIQGLPVTWFIDREGFVRGQVFGLVTDTLLKANLEKAGFVP